MTGAGSARRDWSDTRGAGCVPIFELIDESGYTLGEPHPSHVRAKDVPKFADNTRAFDPMDNDRARAYLERNGMNVIPPRLHPQDGTWSPDAPINRERLVADLRMVVHALRAQENAINRLAALVERL